MEKRVLLIGGGGTLGTYTAKELLAEGCTVEVLCPEEKTGGNEHLIYHRGLGTADVLSGLFAEKHYDGIVNFIYYKTLEEYKEIHPLLIENTDHLIFLSSYRVYADEMHPITEEAPRLYDVVKSPDLLENEDYAIPKSKCEDYLRNECKGQSWTIVRPVISFSNRRLDLLMYSGREVLDHADEGKELFMPEFVKDFSAGIDWAGNSGKLIARLLFKPCTIGETYTVYSGHGMTWGEVAEVYAELTGVKIVWCSEEEFLKNNPKITEQTWSWTYDRKYNRDVDCSKILKATELSEKDFESVRFGIKQELERLGWKRKN